MAKHRFIKYAHVSTDENISLEKHFNNPELKYCCCEVSLLVEYDDVTKQCEVIGVDGTFLGEEEYGSSEVTCEPGRG